MSTASMEITLSELPSVRAALIRQSLVRTASTTAYFNSTGPLGDGCLRSQAMLAGHLSILKLLLKLLHGASPTDKHHAGPTVGTPDL
jgi:hypothetical protein